MYRFGEVLEQFRGICFSFFGSFGCVDAWIGDISYWFGFQFLIKIKLNFGRSFSRPTSLSVVLFARYLLLLAPYRAPLVPPHSVDVSGSLIHNCVIL